MSRRRASRSQHKHLEHIAEVAEQVHRAEVVRTSRGPCPGSCNRGHRRRAEEHADAVMVRWAEVLQETRAGVIAELQAGGAGASPAAVAGVVERLRDEILTSAERLAGEDVHVPPARRGAPVWCLRCAAEISDAVHNLPRLVAWVVDIGVSPVPTRKADGSGDRRVPVTDPVRVLATVPGAPGEAAEVLACGHRRSIPFGPVADPSPSRVCRTCTVGVIVPEPGRLSPPPARAQGSSSSGRPPVSPLGSPAWAEADAAVEWSTAAADTARYVLGHARPSRSASGSSAFRFRELVAACRYLEQWLDQLVAEPGAVPLGQDVLAIAGRLRRVTGMDNLVHRLDAECPVCNRRALERPDGGDRIRCRGCRNTWDERHYDLLVRTQHYEATQHRDDGGDAMAATR